MRNRHVDEKELDCDLIFLVVTLLLLSMGAIMVYSASFCMSREISNSDTYYMVRHLIHLSMGIAIMFSLMQLDYRRLNSKVLAYLALLVGFVSLVLCFIPGIGVTGGNARRWIRVMGFTFQSSELMKIMLVLFISHFLTRKSKSIGKFSVGVLPVLIITGTAAIFIFLEPDFGTAALLLLWATTMLFIAGMRWKHTFLIGSGSLPIVVLMLLSAPYRRDRLTAFLDPWSHIQDIGYQIVHSMLAFAKGGVLGAGLGEGTQKLFYLPAPHTDFIFSVIGEELGLLGVLVVIVLFSVWIWRAFFIALATKDTFGFYLVVASCTFIGLQAIINIGVTMSVLPTTGMALPFFSYGGSAMLMVSVASGMILSVSRRARL